MFDMLSDLFDRDGKKRHGRSSGLRGMLQRLIGGEHYDDHRRYRGRYRDDDDYFDRDYDRGYSSRRRRYRDDDDDDDD
jgi:hypothetical protein